MSKRLEKNSSQKFIVGDKLTIADFAIASVSFATFMNENNPSKGEMLPYVEKFPVLLAYIQGLGDELKEHLSARF